MSLMWWSALGIALAVGAAVAIVWGPLVTYIRARNLERAQASFRRRREWLEAEFFQRAAASGKPRHLRWANCEFDDAVHFARRRRSGELCAFVGVSVSFEAVEGGLMEDVAAVGDVRAATAVFRHTGGQWIAEGRVMFNFDPPGAIEFYHDELESIAPPLR